MINLKQYLSLIISFVAYTLLVDWRFAILFTIGIGFHEMCHIWAAKYYGLTTKGFFLIPFVGGGAIIEMQDASAKQQAVVSLAGPIGGGLLAIITLGIYLLTNFSYIGYAAFWMLALNLFNLLPLSVLDGGRVAEALADSIGKRTKLVVVTVSGILGTIVLLYFNFIIGVLVAILTWSKITLAYSEYKEQGLLTAFDLWTDGSNKKKYKTWQMKDVEMIMVSMSWFAISVILLICLITPKLLGDESIKLLRSNRGQGSSSN